MLVALSTQTHVIEFHEKVSTDLDTNVTVMKKVVV